MKAAVISHGEILDYEYTRDIIKGCDIVICADGGAEYAVKCGINPDIVIGDLDSIDSAVLNIVVKSGSKVIKYPKDKDYTDTQLAIDYAISEGAHEIVMVGSVGDRIDHSLANIFTLVKMAQKNIKAMVVNEKNTVYITNNCLKLNGKVGDIVSIIPICGDASGIYTDGLQYKLYDATITMGDPLGISNVFDSENISIKVGTGYLLVILARD